MPHYRFRRTAEDAGPRGVCLAPRAELVMWVCSICGQPNDPRPEWPTCCYCGRFRKDCDESHPDYSG